MCPATTDLQFAREKKGAFEGIDGEAEVVGLVSCGGCPGKKAVIRAQEMVWCGAKAIAFTSCITKGNQIGFVCPFAKKMREAVASTVGEEILIIDYTH